MNWFFSNAAVARCHTWVNTSHFIWWMMIAIIHPFDRISLILFQYHRYQPPHLEKCFNQTESVFFWCHQQWPLRLRKIFPNLFWWWWQQWNFLKKQYWLYFYASTMGHNTWGEISTNIFDINQSKGWEGVRQLYLWR